MTIVLVTGATSGIGLETVKQLSKSSQYIVYGTYRNPATSKSLESLAQTRSNVHLVEMDVTLTKSVIDCVQKILKEQGRIDLLVNNAGAGIYGPVETVSIPQARNLYDTNVLGVMRVLHAVLPSMRSNKKGHIINIGSISGVVPSKNLPVYSGTKFALATLSASLMRELEPYSIRVSLILPGPVVTKFSAPQGRQFRQFQNPYQKEIEKNRREWQHRMKQGQSAQEVAEIIQKTIESKAANFWVPTSPWVEEKIQMHYKDPTGNSWTQFAPYPASSKL